MLKYLMDENVNPVYINQLRRRKPDLIIRAIGEPDTPLKGTLDPEIIIWCEAYNFLLITNNRTSMPVHLVDHIIQVIMCRVFLYSTRTWVLVRQLRN